MRDCGNVIVVMLVDSKQPPEIVLRIPYRGRITVWSEEHDRKTSSSSTLRLLQLKRSTDWSDLQFWNDFASISVSNELDSKTMLTI